MYMGDLFTTRFGPKGQSAVNTYIKITKRSCWVMSGLYLNGILFLQLIGLYCRVIVVCINVVVL
jgi:hypothetical protein